MCVTEGGVCLVSCAWNSYLSSLNFLFLNHSFTFLKILSPDHSFSIASGASAISEAALLPCSVLFGFGFPFCGRGVAVGKRRGVGDVPVSRCPFGACWFW